MVFEALNLLFGQIKCVIGAIENNLGRSDPGAGSRHTAKLLQASGRANALRALLKDEQERGPYFLRLANALSALYPEGGEEKKREVIQIGRF